MIGPLAGSADAQHHDVCYVGDVFGGLRGGATARVAVSNRRKHLQTEMLWPDAS
jgi:hypothetical protein